jgi:hypothetical protein
LTVLPLPPIPTLLKPSVTLLTISITKTGMITISVNGLSLVLNLTLVMIILNHLSFVMDSECAEVTLISVLELLLLSISEPPSIKVLVMKLWLSLTSNSTCSKKLTNVLTVLPLPPIPTLLKPSVTLLTISITKTGLMMISTLGLSLMLNLTLVTITLNHLSFVLDSECAEVTLISVPDLLLKPISLLLTPTLISELPINNTLLLLGIMKPSILN